jgi:hypothetical protein
MKMNKFIMLMIVLVSAIGCYSNTAGFNPQPDPPVNDPEVNDPEITCPESLSIQAEVEGGGGSGGNKAHCE